MNPAEHILRTLARHLEGPAQIRLFGGAALILGYGLNRSTEDADLLEDEAEVELLIERANFGAALEATNRELAPEGLYLTHIFGPKQQILSPKWRESCRRVERDWGSPLLEVSVLGPIDLILTKLCRADDEDLEDVAFLVRAEQIGRLEIEAALDSAIVPTIFAEIFAESRARVLRLIDDLERAR